MLLLVKDSLQYETNYEKFMSTTRWLVPLRVLASFSLLSTTRRRGCGSRGLPSQHLLPICGVLVKETWIQHFAVSRQTRALCCVSSDEGSWLAGATLSALAWRA